MAVVVVIAAPAAAATAAAADTVTTTTSSPLALPAELRHRSCGAADAAPAVSPSSSLSHGRVGALAEVVVVVVVKVAAACA